MFTARTLLAGRWPILIFAALTVALPDVTGALYRPVAPILPTPLDSVHVIEGDAIALPN